MGSEFISPGTLKPIQIYMPCSAPWYTELLLDGAMVAVVVVVCIVLKLVIWRKLKP